MIIFVAKMIMTETLGHLLFKNYRGAFHLEFCNPNEIKMALNFFPNAYINYTLLPHENSRDMLDSLFPSYHIASKKLLEYTFPIENVVNFNRIRSTFEHGIPPDLTGEFYWYLKNIEYGYSFDGMSNYSDLLKRYSELKSIFDFAKNMQKLKTRKELRGQNFREKGGINVIQIANGGFIWAGGGLHRLVMAQVLRLNLIPVCVIRRDRALLKPRIWTGLILKVCQKYNIKISC